MISVRASQASVAAMIALVATALPLPSLAAPLSPGTPAMTSVDGHWTRLFDDMPWNNWGDLIWDPVHQRVSLGGMLELDLTRPNLWTKIAGSSGLPGVQGIDDPIGDRIVAIASWPVPDSLQVHALPLSIPGANYFIPSMNSPFGRFWGGFTQTFDAANNAITLFGGIGNDPMFGTRNYVNWVCHVGLAGGVASFGPIVSPAGGPSLRSFHCTVTDAARQHMVVFGGQNQFGKLNDVKIGSLDGSTWITPVISGTPPSIRSASTAISDPLRDRMLVYGGKGLNDLWQLTLSDPLTWSALVPSGGPPATQTDAGTAVYEPRVERMVLYGPGGTDELWSLTLTPSLTWIDHTIPHPGGDNERSVVTDPVRRSMVVYGASGIPYDLSFETMTWSIRSTVGPAPSKRGSAAMVYDAPRQRIVLFGGRQLSDNARLNDVWVLGSGPTPFWTHIFPVGTPPSPRIESSAIYDPVRQRLIVFGGMLGILQKYNDVWALDLSGTPTWTQLTPSGPGPTPRTACGAVYDPVRDRMLLIGSSSDAEVWALSLGGAPTWQQLPSHPVPLATRPGAEYDPVLDRVLAFISNQLYELTLSGTPTWRLLTPTGATPPGGGSAQLAYDATTDRFFMLSSSNTDDTYVLGFGARVDVPGIPSIPGVHLAACTPNPTQRGASMRYTLAQAGPARLAIYDVSGRLVTVLADGSQTAGPHEVAWDGRSASGVRVTPGVYLYALEWEGSRIARRLAVIR